jgi:hypothetical protein
VYIVKNIKFMLLTTVKLGIFVFCIHVVRPTERIQMYITGEGRLIPLDGCL